MRTYRVAVVGCRARGAATAHAYHAHPRAEVVALCDLIRARVDELGDALGVAARYDDVDAMIERERPDIVAISTATEAHYDLAMRVLEHGVHMDVEKPLCVDLAQADAVMAKAADKGVRIAVHHQHRCGKAARAMAHALAEGRIGELRHMTATGKGYYGGFELINIGTHTVNALLAFAPRCHHVCAVANTGGHVITPDDVVPSPHGMGTIAGEHITATLHFDHPVTALLVQHRRPATDTGQRWIVLHGTEGQLAWRRWAGWWLPHPADAGPPGSAAWQRLAPIGPACGDPDGGVSADDYAFADEFVHALDENRDHECGGETARHVLEILMGVFESAAYGTRVDLPQAHRGHPLLRWRREHGLGDPEPIGYAYAEWLTREDRRLGR